MIVVADTSVLLNLAFLGLDDLLSGLFREIWVPDAVAAEFRRMSASSGRFGGLQMPSCCQVRSVLALPPEIAGDVRLDPGAAEALGLAIQYKADAVLIDEVFARGAAVRLGIKVIGTAGLLVIAKQRGLTPEVAPLLRKLIVQGSFRLSGELLQDVLRKAGELP